MTATGSRLPGGTDRHQEGRDLKRSALARALAEDWPYSLRAAGEIVLGGWLLTVLVCVAAYSVSSSHDAAAALSVGSAVRVGTGVWATALGGGLPLTGEHAWVLSLPALGLTGIILVLARGSIRRAHLTSLAGAVLTALAVAAGSALLLVATRCASAVTLPAAGGLGLLTALLALARQQADGYGSAWLSQRWRGRSPAVRACLVLTRDTSALLVACSLAAVIAAGLVAARRVAALHDVITGGGVVASAGVVLLELAWAPVALIWALAWVIGPGFSVGTATVFSPDQVIAGPVPALPVLGALPRQPLGGEGAAWVGQCLPLVLVLGALAVPVIHRRRLRELTLARACLAAAGAAGLITLATALACLAASGAVGPGRLAHAGPLTGPTTLLVALETGTGLMAATVLLHPTTHRASAAGARATARASVHAAHQARARAADLADRRGDLAEHAPDGAGAPGALSSPSSLTHRQGATMTHASSGTAPTGHTQPAEPGPGPRTAAAGHPDRGNGLTRVVVLVSGTGSNLAALLTACAEPEYGARIVGVVADKECGGLEHARAAGVRTVVVSPRDYEDRRAWDVALTDAVADLGPELIVCAGFMRILGQPFLERFEGSVINTHPSLLPDFPGAHAVRDALAAGATRTGATLFWVDAGVDTGAHIAQVEVPVEPGDTEETLTARVKAAETPQLVEQVGVLARAWHERD